MLIYYQRARQRPIRHSVRTRRHGRVASRRLTPRPWALIVKAHMGRLGHPVTASHSHRRGHATSAARSGAAERTIIATTGHRSTRTVPTYIEQGQLIDDPSGHYLGL